MSVSSVAWSSSSPRDLLADELVVRLVVVERVDHVVAVAPRVRPRVVLLEARRVGVAGHVEPVPAPALAVVGRGQQPVDEPLPGAARRIGQELVGLRRRRRHAGEIQVGAAQQRQPVGPRRRHDPRLPARRLEKAVHRVGERAGRRNRGACRTPESPVVARPGGQLAALQRRQRGTRRGGGAGVPMRALLDPDAQGRHLGVRQRLAAHRHRGPIEARHHAEEPAVLRAAGHQRRSLRAALERAGARAEIEAGKLRRGAVAVPAAPLHDGADVVLERDARRLGRGRGGQRRRDGHRQDARDQRSCTAHFPQTGLRPEPHSDGAAPRTPGVRLRGPIAPRRYRRGALCAPCGDSWPTR